MGTNWALSEPEGNGLSRPHLDTTVFPTLEDVQKQVIHAPPGFGKRQAVLAWLQARGRRWVWVDWRAPEPQACAGDNNQRRVWSASELETVLNKLATQDVGQLILMNHDLQADQFPWSIVANYVHQKAFERCVVVTHRFPFNQNVLQAPVFSYWNASDALRMSIEEIQSMIPDAQRPSSQQAATILNRCGEWPAPIFAICRQFPTTFRTGQLELQLREAFIGAEQYYGLAQNPHWFVVLRFLLDMEQVPERLWGPEGPCNSLYDDALAVKSLGLASDNGLGCWSLRTEIQAFVTQLIDTHPSTAYQTYAEAAADWLEREGYWLQALALRMRLKHWEASERLLLQAAVTQLSSLQLDRLAQAFERIDHHRPISEPRLLMVAVRCAFLRGNAQQASQYYSRLLDAIEPLDREAFGRSMDEQQWHRFRAELLLYADFTGHHQAYCREWVDATIGSSSDSLPELMRAAYEAANQGQLAHLMPMTYTGLEKARQGNVMPSYLAFGIIHYWGLVLSGQLQVAESLRDEMQRTLIQQGINFPGAHGWLELMGILATRMWGNLPSALQQLEAWEQDSRFTQDARKHHLLLNLLAEIHLLQGRWNDARHAINKLITLREQHSMRAYWLPNPEVMNELLDQLSHDPPRALTALQGPDNRSELASLDMETQTQVFWRLKASLWQGDARGVLDQLEAFEKLYIRTGQWLRLLELQWLWALALNRNGQRERAATIANSVLTRLKREGLIGVLFDPFGLWREAHALLQDKHWHTLDQLAEGILASPHPVSNASRTHAGELSNREQQVLKLLAEGLSNQGIGETLSISITTVRTHLQNIYRKLGVTNRAGAVSHAQPFSSMK